MRFKCIFIIRGCGSVRQHATYSTSSLKRQVAETERNQRNPLTSTMYLFNVKWEVVTVSSLLLLLLINGIE